MTRAPRLGDVLHGRDNNLNLVRMIAASAVMFSHAYALSLGQMDGEPIFALTDQPVAAYAVALFFGISGLLIARSWERRPDPAHFVIARFLRLYPALAAVLTVTLLAALAVTTLPAAAFLADPRTASYVPSNLALADPQYTLPGVFNGNPYGPAINGSLWTLFYEVLCYAGVLAAGIAGLFARRGVFTALLALTVVAHAVPVEALLGRPPPLRVVVVAELAFPFALGTLAFLWRDKLPLSGWLVLTAWLMVAAAWTSPLLPSFIVAALIYSALVFGFAKTPRLGRYNRLGDYSYGTYIYAFPMQQLAVWLWPGQSPAANLALAVPPTILCAVLSWHLMEKRALARIFPVTGRIHRLLGRPAAAL